MNGLNVVEIIIVLGLCVLLFLLFRAKRKLRGVRVAVLFFLIIIFMGHISMQVILEKPEIQLNGETSIVIEAGKDTYEELGADVKYHKNARREEMQEKIEIRSNVDTQKVGEYSVQYQIPFGDALIVKERKVKVIDTIAPQLELKGKKEVRVPENSGYVEDRLYCD